MEKHVLIVDDDEDLSFIIVEMLEGHGFSVTSAQTKTICRTMERTAIVRQSHQKQHIFPLGQPETEITDPYLFSLT